MSHLAQDEIIPANFLGGIAGKRRSEVSAIFDRVADKSNWKLPIKAEVALDFADSDLLREAVIFFTGSVPTMEVIEPFLNRNDGRSMYRVTAAGYYSAVGA